MGEPPLRDRGGPALTSTLDGPGPALGTAPAPPVARRRAVPTWVPVLALYLLASLAFYRRVLPDVTGTQTGAIASDSGLFVWWLNWVPWALGHGQNPLYTTWMNAPAGVNALWNTTVPVLGALLAPVTATLGAAAAYNLGMVLGPVASAFGAYLALGRWVGRSVARALGGGLYGFCPFIIAHAWAGHLNIVWMVLPPVLLWAVHALFLDDRRSWWVGAALGLAFAVQTGLYTQTVALGAVALVVVAVVLAVRAPGAVRARLPHLARATVACMAVYLVLCAYPLWLLMAGPGRPRGPVRDVTLTGADAANSIVPTALTGVRAGTAPLAAALRAYVGEQGSYVGLAVVLVVVVAVIVVRSTVLRCAAAVTAVLGVLSLGTSLTVLGHDTGFPLLWRALMDVPLVGEAEPGRLAPFVALGVVLVLVLALDRAVDRRGWVAVGAVLLAALSWLPADVQPVTASVVPSFFTTGAPGLAPGEIVETWPRATGRWEDGADPLWWQMAAGMGYRQAGGYFLGSDAQHDLLMEGPVSEYHLGALGEAADPVRARTELHTHGVTAIVVVPRADVDLPVALRWTAAVTGDPGRSTGGAWLFRLR